MLQIRLLGIPGKKQRVQFNWTGHRAFTPKRTVTFEGFVRAETSRIMQERRLAPIMGPVRVDIVASFSIPQSWPAWRKDAARQGLVAHTSKPDKDNIEKAILDGMNAIAWRDDSAVSCGGSEKTYGFDRDFTLVKIKALRMIRSNAKRSDLETLLDPIWD